MSRPSERASRRWSTVNASRRSDSNSTEDSSSATESNEYSSYAKNISPPSRSRWTNSEINRSRNREDRESQGTDEESSDEKDAERSRGRKDGTRKKRQDHERIAPRPKGRHDRRGKRRSRHSEESEVEKRKEMSAESDPDHSKRKSREFRGDDELPITEILKRSQENARTKYEHQPPFPELTTDKIYVQYRDGFSAMKISRSRGTRRGAKPETEGRNDVENRDSPPIRVAIAVQQFSKSIGLVFQGLLGGMALMHFIMLHILFDDSMEFVIDHSTICEIYANMFSFLIAMCIVSTLDKFDLARFDVYHLREIYCEYNRAVLAVPLYLIVFCLHQISSRTDNRLASVHYYGVNDSLWENATSMQSIVDDLISWQRISMSKDILAVFAWLFVSLGTKDDAFLVHLRSMEKYANDAEASQR
ncbi:uncharacterized protein LOC143340924 [Colletes latitarsis]|uniref:uncharacterized protein LOC143340924 n=1 Tax=Colletes latitarsis TaxID=2605962 RepID=UPI004037053F